MDDPLMRVEIPGKKHAIQERRFIYSIINPHPRRLAGSANPREQVFSSFFWLISAGMHPADCLTLLRALFRYHSHLERLPFSSFTAAASCRNLVAVGFFLPLSQPADC